MSKDAEYVEKYVFEGFKRQLEQEENIVRSLPFFVAALTLLGTIVGASGWSLVPFDGTCIPSKVVWGLAAAVMVLIVLTILGLLVAVLPFKYLYPTDEATFIAFAKEVRDKFVAAATDEDTDDIIESAIVETLREAAISRYQASAERNRKINARRQSGRSVALLSLVLAIAFALATSGTIYGLNHQFIAGGACYAPQHENSVSGASGKGR